MRNKVQEENIFWLCLGVFFILISTFFIIVLTRQYSRVNELRIAGGKTVGTIEKIESRNIGATNRFRTNVYVRYTADGNEYRNIINYYTPWMRVGNKIDIYYDPGNPSRASGGEETRFIVIGAGVILLCLLAGFLTFQAGVRGLMRGRTRQK